MLTGIRTYGAVLHDHQDGIMKGRDHYHSESTAKLLSQLRVLILTPRLPRKYFLGAAKTDTTVKAYRPNHTVTRA